MLFRSRGRDGCREGPSLAASEPVHAASERGERVQGGRPCEAWEVQEGRPSALLPPVARRAAGGRLHHRLAIISARSPSGSQAARPSPHSISPLHRLCSLKASSPRRSGCRRGGTSASRRSVSACVCILGIASPGSIRSWCSSLIVSVPMFRLLHYQASCCTLQPSSLRVTRRSACGS